MEFPSWFKQMVQKRLDKVSAQVAYHPDIEQIRKEEDIAFKAMFAEIDIKHSPIFSEWEDRHNLMQAMMNEKLYFRGMQDGIQLAVVILYHSCLQDEEAPSTGNPN